LNPKIITLDNGRLYLPRNLVPKWDEETPLLLVPLNWKRTVPIPDLNQSETWFLCNTDELVDGDWRLSPKQARGKSNSEAIPSYWNHFVFDLKLEKHVVAWRLLLPILVRNLGWITKGGKVVAIPEPDGLTLLSETALRLLVASLPEQWENTD